MEKAEEKSQKGKLIAFRPTREVSAALNRDMAKTSANKSKIINDALRLYLRKRAKQFGLSESDFGGGSSK